MKYLLVCFMMLSSCFGAEKLKILTSFSILKDIVQNVAGDRADVESIVGPNQDTHIFEPTPASNHQISNADIVFMNGLGFETWMERLVEATEYKKPLVKVSDGITAIHLLQSKNKKVAVEDPHVWNNVQNIKVWVRNVEKALIKLDPEHRKIYETNTQKYMAELDALDTWIKKQFQGLPKDTCKVITAHDAFGYYEKAYGVTFLAPVGLSTVDEPSAFEIAELVDMIRKEKIKTIFIENITNRKIIEQLSQETGAKIGPVLFSDALSDVKQGGHTYIKMMRYNTQTILDSLPCFHGSKKPL